MAASPTAGAEAVGDRRVHEVIFNAIKLRIRRSLPRVPDENAPFIVTFYFTRRRRGRLAVTADATRAQQVCCSWSDAARDYVFALTVGLTLASDWR